MSLVDCSPDKTGRGATKEGHPFARTHGHRVSANGGPSLTYVSWDCMMARCYRKKHPAYDRYGGAGITVCDRWRGRDGFANFLADMGERPCREITLDRLRNGEGYSKDNCAWATKLQQTHNRRTRRKNLWWL